MYLERFKLREFPFRLTPDPSFLYLSEQHAKAKSYMESTLLLADGFVVITGEIGSGKTTLIESFLSTLDDDVDTARIHQTQVTPIEFLQAVLIEFGYEPFDKDKTQLTQMLNQHLLKQYAAKRKIVLIVDEAQNLTHSVLEELRLISGLETTKEKVLSIILAGQPEFNDTLNSPRLAQLAQRTRLRFHIGALSVEETKEYVNHRLQVAGAGKRKLIDDSAIAPIHYFTGGVPRLINTLCDTAFLVAFQQQAKSISEKIVKETADELNWQERTFPIGMSPQARHPKLRDQEQDSENESSLKLLQDQVLDQQKLISTLQQDISQKLANLDDVAADLKKPAQSADAEEHKQALKEARELLEEKAHRIHSLEAGLAKREQDFLDLGELRKNDHAKIKELEQLLSDSGREIGELHVDIEAKRHDITELEQKLTNFSELQQSHSTQSQELDRANQELKERQSQLEKLEAQLEKQATNVKELQELDSLTQEQLTEQKNQILKLEGNLLDVQGELSERETDIKSLQVLLEEERTGKSSLSTTLEDKGKLLTTTENTNAELREEINQLQAQLQEKIQLSESLEKKVSELSANIDALNASVAEQSEHKSLLDQEIRERGEIITRLESELAGTKSVIDGNLGEFTRFDEKVKELSEIIAAKDRNIKHLETLQRETHETLEGYEADLALKVAQIADLTKSGDAQSTEIKSLNEKLDSLNQSVSDLEASLATAQDELAKEVASHAETKSNIEQAQETIKHNEKKSGAKDEQLAQKDEKLAELRAVVREHKALAKDAKEKLEANLKDQEKLKQDLEHARKLKQQLQDKVKEHNHRNNNQKKELAASKKREKTLNSKLQKRAKEIDQLNQDIERLEDIWTQIQSWENSIKGYKSEIRIKSQLIDKLQDELGTVKDDAGNFKEQSAKANDLESKLTASIEEVTTLKKDLEGSRQSIEALTQDNIEAKQKLSESAIELEQRNQKIRDLERDLQESASFVDSLQDEIHAADLSRKSEHVDTVRIQKGSKSHLPPAKLLMSNDGVYNAEFTLDNQRVVIGRSSDNDVRIQSEFVSRHHAQIISTPFSSVIEDLNSSNGIYVNSKRVKKHRLKHRDIIRIGKHTLIFVNEADQEARSLEQAN